MVHWALYQLTPPSLHNLLDRTNISSVETPPQRRKSRRSPPKHWLRNGPTWVKAPTSASTAVPPLLVASWSLHSPGGAFANVDRVDCSVHSTTPTTATSSSPWRTTKLSGVPANGPASRTATRRCPKLCDPLIPCICLFGIPFSLVLVPGYTCILFLQGKQHPTAFLSVDTFSFAHTCTFIAGVWYPGLVDNKFNKTTSRIFTFNALSLLVQIR